MAIRPEIQTFANLMEFKLSKYDDRKGWQFCNLHWLLNRLKEEVAELEISLNTERIKVSKVGYECADVANFAMMIFDTSISQKLIQEAGIARQKDVENILDK